jgi:SseB protein C-terminal domain
LSAAAVYLPTNDEGALPFVDTPAGRCVPVFSSLETLGRSRPEGGRYLRVPRAALPTLCPDGFGVLLDDSVALTPDAAADLTQPLVGEPVEEPEELLEALRAFAETRQDVHAAYRALVVPPAGEPAICIAFDLEAGVDERALLEAAADAVSDVAQPLFVPLREGGDLARFLRGRTAPFWESRQAVRAVR